MPKPRQVTFGLVAASLRRAAVPARTDDDDAILAGGPVLCAGRKVHADHPDLREPLVQRLAAAGMQNGGYSLAATRSAGHGW
jgi:hypothetical protein